MITSFIGIDWSGAQGPRQPGIQLAIAKQGRGVPISVSPEDGRSWGRDGILSWLLEAAETGPVLAGIDFAFAHPFVDEGAYYPGLAASPHSPVELWNLIEGISVQAPHLYGGAMFAAAGFGDFYLSPKNHGAPNYASRRRVTEGAARAAGRSPSPTFKAIGADNVATGSMAGMRLIHALKSALGSRLSVWPFDPVFESESNLNRGLAMILVEIFPSYYFHRAGLNPAKNAAADPGFMTAALAAYDSDGVARDYVPKGADADESDALISAAALRYFAREPWCWQVPDAALTEGWIFGVPQGAST